MVPHSLGGNSLSGSDPSVGATHPTAHTAVAATTAAFVVDSKCSLRRAPKTTTAAQWRLLLATMKAHAVTLRARQPTGACAPP